MATQTLPESPPQSPLESRPESPQTPSPSSLRLVRSVYAAAARAGLLQTCTWQPSWADEQGSANGAALQSHPVSFSHADQELLDGLALGTEVEMTYPADAFEGLAPNEQVQVAAVTYLVREVRALADGSERRARLSRV